MSFIDEPLADRMTGPARIMSGSVAAAVLPSLVSPMGFWFTVINGLMAVFLIYVPLILWRLAGTRRPFLTCFVLGMVAAPGPLGFGLLLTSFAQGLDAVRFVATAVAIFALPLGAIGGCVFFLCAVWKNPDFAPARAT